MSDLKKILILLCIPLAGVIVGLTLRFLFYDYVYTLEKESVRIVETEVKAKPQLAEFEYYQAEPIETSGQQIVSLGTFTAYAYCCENYPHICNNGNATKTATGTTPTVGRTIAVDPSIIPLGTQVIINGHTYTAEDTGGAIKGKRVDILHATHQDALQWGKRQVEIFIVR